ncbi:MAG TPA: glycosyltransferase [Bryobacteraceae bacterium]|jgi:glycosyltransferase involved in cell wall biosynthesis|nr:glycosyltransferase [Bryobacteraceae bacterium]
MSIKTLHLTNCFHSESGGIATFYRELLKSAERLERHIRLVVPSDRSHTEIHGRYGKIYYVPAAPSRLSPGYRLLMPSQYLLPRSPLRCILAEEKPELVECCDKYTLNYLAALLRRGWLGLGTYRPAMVGLTCERMDENVASYLSAGKRGKSWCRAYLKWLYFPMFDHHIAVSQHTAGELREVSHGHDVRRGVWVRSMGASCGLFRPERRSPEKGQWLRSLTAAPDTARLLLYAGRLVPEKNLQLLLETLAWLEQDAPGVFHLVVAGQGSQRASLETQCNQRLPGAAYFLGHIADRELLADVYANCEAFLHPNPREPFGIAPLEAMASGLPLVAPSSGGIATYANSQNAWLANPDPESFAQAVHAICGDAQAASARCRAARATAERYDWDGIAEGFFELYDELHALVQGGRAEPSIAPAFYSTERTSPSCQI